MDIMLEILKFIQSFSNDTFDFLFELITMLGEDYFFIIVTALFYWCFNKNLGYKLAFIYLTSGTINTMIKEIIKFPRPIGYEGIRSIRVETAGGYSFPSGHTQQTTSLFTTLMIVFKKKWLYFVGIISMLLVAFSRMYLGVHWPTDVLGGLIIGVLWTIFSIKLFDWAKNKENPILLGVLVIPMFVCILFFKTSTYFKAIGTLTTLWIGYIVEDKYIKYETKAVWWKQVIKAGIGFFGLVFIKVFVKQLLPLNIYSDFLRYALMGFWMTVISPIIFRVLNIEERKELGKSNKHSKEVFME
ncbi:MAG TPA: phosphatase PAP2 family protein [Defluviitaleaceae bacterium]|nr:phosphatase PAP2 family protein [Candidatus Epulonipiscium sp.]HOA81190.1 phosphatase PAP2 family protein [Defluviitaleaceae bacterium]